MGHVTRHTCTGNYTASPEISMSSHARAHARAYICINVQIYIYTYKPRHICIYTHIMYIYIYTHISSDMRVLAAPLLRLFVEHDHVGISHVTHNTYE